MQKVLEASSELRVTRWTRAPWASSTRVKRRSTSPRKVSGSSLLSPVYRLQPYSINSLSSQADARLFTLPSGLPSAPWNFSLRLVLPRFCLHTLTCLDLTERLNWQQLVDQQLCLRVQISGQFSLGSRFGAQRHVRAVCADG